MTRVRRCVWSGMTPLLMLVFLAACGGGDGSGVAESAPSRRDPTRFVGNLSEPTVAQSPWHERALAALHLASAAYAQAGPVRVCVEGTDFCTSVDVDGVFVLDAAVGGDVVLLFSGPDFTARLMLNDVPPGSTVTIRDVRCSPVTGRCAAADVAIESPENAAPICSEASARPAVLWPPNHAMVGIVIDDVFDPDGDPVEILAVGVFQDEPPLEDDSGSGNTAPDARLQPLGVRAERSGQGNGRVYLIGFTADDGKGGMCSGVVEVCVPHDQGQGAACVDDGAQFDSLQE